MSVEGGLEIRGSCSLELAARTGRPEDNVVRLLELGADFNEVPHAENWCCSACHARAKRRDWEALFMQLHLKVSHSEIVSLLLKRGANEGLKDSKGRIALDRAKRANHQHVVTLLETTI
jgi:hypothetical protein